MLFVIATPVSRLNLLKHVADSVIIAKKYVDTSEYSEDIKLRWLPVADTSIVTTEKQADEFYNKTLESRPDVAVIPIIGDTYKAVAGHSHRNKVLNILESTNKDDVFFYSLDDDNILIADIIIETYKAYKEGFLGLIGSQMNPDGSTRLLADPESIGLNKTDTAQFAFNVKLLNGLRFDPARYDADGVFIEQLYNENKDKFKVIQQPVCYYNKLR